MGGNLGYYHDKGATDARDGDYSPPHGVMDSLLTWSGDGMSRDIEENKAYDQGYFHTRGQIDQGNNDYDAPSNSDCREAYDAGWEAAKNS